MPCSIAGWTGACAVAAPRVMSERRQKTSVFSLRSMEVRGSGRREPSPAMCSPFPSYPCWVLGEEPSQAARPARWGGSLPPRPTLPLSRHSCKGGGRREPPHCMDPAWLPPRPQQGYLWGHAWQGNLYLLAAIKSCQLVGGRAGKRSSHHLLARAGKKNTTTCWLVLVQAGSELSTPQQEH